jgi:hypothetical protein
MQNQTLVEEFIDATEQIGLSEITGKCIDGGRKILLKARIGDVTIGNDTVKRYITVSNSHDGSSQVLLGMHNTVMICTNGLTREINHNQLGIVKHTTNSGDKMNWYIRNLPKVIQAEEEMIKTYKKLSEIQVNKKHVKRVIEKIYEVDMSQLEEEVSTRKKNMIRKFDETLHTNGLNVHGNTLWGLLQTVTFLTSHDKEGKIQEEKGMYGKGQEMGNMTYELLVDFINNPVHETEEVYA